MTRTLLVLPLLLLAPACATVTQGASQDIAVLTPNVSGAQCVIAEADGDIVARLTSPGQARISRGRQALLVRCETQDLAGVAEAQSSFSSRSRIQSPIGYAVDGISGAMWSYPAEVTVPLSPKTGR